MKEKISLGVIGCGYWGPNLIRNFNSLNECSIKWMCDKNTERLSHMKSLYRDVHTTTNSDDIISDPEIDAVIIATPVNFHFPLAEKSLLQGKHTFIEKPLASSVSECSRLVQIAEDKNLTLMTGHTFIYSSPIKKIKEILLSGEIGELLYINSRRLNLGLFQKDINVAWDLAPHDISIVLYLLGSLPCSVNCYGRAHVNPGVEDVTNMILNFPNGKFVSIQSSWLDPQKVREMKFVGSKKMIVYDDTEPLEKIKVYDKRVETPPHYDTFAEFHYSYHYGDMYSPYLQQVEPLKTEAQHFLSCIKNGTKPDSSGIEGMQVVQVLEASLQSLQQSGARIDINNNRDKSTCLQDRVPETYANKN